MCEIYNNITADVPEEEHTYIKTLTRWDDIKIGALMTSGLELLNRKKLTETDKRYRTLYMKIEKIANKYNIVDLFTGKLWFKLENESHNILKATNFIFNNGILLNSSYTETTNEIVGIEKCSGEKRKWDDVNYGEIITAYDLYTKYMETLDDGPMDRHLPVFMKVGVSDKGMTGSNVIVDLRTGKVSNIGDKLNVCVLDVKNIVLK